MNNKQNIRNNSKSEEKYIEKMHEKAKKENITLHEAMIADKNKDIKKIFKKSQKVKKNKKI